MKKMMIVPIIISEVSPSSLDYDEIGNLLDKTLSSKYKRT